MWCALRPEASPTSVLHEFAIDCVYRFDPTGPYPAVDKKQEWLDGDITQEELEAARDVVKNSQEQAEVELQNARKLYGIAVAKKDFENQPALLQSVQTKQYNYWKLSIERSASNTDPKSAAWATVNLLWLADQSHEDWSKQQLLTLLAPHA